jgi:multiple sugar transport system substrate-binding protein
MEPIDTSLIKRLQEGKITRRDFILSAAAAGVSLPSIAGILASSATTPALAASAPSKARFPAGTRLSMKLRAAFMPQGNEVLAALVQEWGKKNGVAVEVDIVSMNDLQTITATAVETGAGPDIIEINQGTAHLYAQRLVDVSSVCNDLAKRFGGYYTAAEEACKVKGKWLSVPRFFAPHAINYRTDLFKKAGITARPKTYDELLAAGKALVDAKLPPVGFALGHAVGDGNDWNYALLWAFGGSDVAKDGKTVAIDSAETRAALAYMQKLFAVMPKDVLAWDDSSNNTAMLAGAISATNNAATIYGTARNQNTQFKTTDASGKEVSAPLYTVIGHFPYPAGPAGRVTYGEFMSSAILGYSKNVEAAKALLTYLNEPAQMNPWVAPNLSFVFPPLKAYKDDPLMPWNTNPNLAAFKDYADTCHLPGYPSTNFSKGTAAYAKWIIVDMFASVCMGTSIDAAITQAKAQLTSIYGG